MPTENEAGGILGRVAALFGIQKEKPPPQQDVIPPGAPLYGPGPDFVNDSIANQQPPMGVATEAGDPWAPIIGRTQPTHQQVGDAALRFGNPRPVASEPDAYWRKVDADDAARHSVQQIDANGWDTPVQPHPDIQKPIRPLSVRPTSYSHPELDSFIVTDRETDGQYRLSGDHFSMADHRRDYPVYEMAPAITRRNTFRLEPTAWDNNLVDMPVEEGLGMNQGPTGYEAAAAIIGGRSHRLGG